MNRIKQYIYRRGILWLMLLCGLYCMGLALWRLAQTAVFFHESITLTGLVIDVRQNHFNSQLEALAHGNMSWSGDISYQPIVAFIMPGGITIPRRDMPDLDNTDYTLGQQVEIITLPHDPNTAHIKKWKFLWGGHCLLLGFGVLSSLPSWLLIRYCPYKHKIKKQRQANRPLSTPDQPTFHKHSSQEAAIPRHTPLRNSSARFSS